MPRTSLLLFLILLMPAPTWSAEQRVPVLQYAPKVSLQIDAGHELNRKISLYMQRHLERAGVNIERSAQWTIVIVAIEPDGNEEKPKRFSMASAFVEQVPHVNAQIVQDLRKSPCLSQESVQQYAQESTLLPRFLSLQASDGSVNDLSKTCSMIVKNFLELCVLPRQKGLSGGAVEKLQGSP